MKIQIDELREENDNHEIEKSTWKKLEAGQLQQIEELNEFIDMQQQKISDLEF